ncbi:MAG: hypothetical protein RI637_11990 [Acidimicrobiia bacterium]|nr:hypothetical protein [Acidimicrobiia bacterium]
MTWLIVHAAATWFMVGLIWTIQTVHYPLFARVGAADFVGYENEHTTRMARLLAVPAGVEIVTGAALVWTRPGEVSLWLVMVAGALLVAIWVTTALVQVPLHRRLSDEGRGTSLEQLVQSNWFRTGLWTARGMLVTAMLLV